MLPTQPGGCLNGVKLSSRRKRLAETLRFGNAGGKGGAAREPIRSPGWSTSKLYSFNEWNERPIMRGIAYVVAVVAALGIMFVIATSPDQRSESSEGLEFDATSAVATPELMVEAGSLTLSVPEMHCEFACFPKVKETLESAGGVDEVTLAAQKEEGVLDNRQVIVKYQPGFNVREAIATLEAAGYTESEIVQ